MYTSMTNTLDSIVDCRMIQLDMEMFSLTTKQAEELADYTKTYFFNLLSPECYILWRNDENNRKGSYENVFKENRSCFQFSFCADVVSPVVYNRKSFQAYDKDLFSWNGRYAKEINTGLVKTDVSSDYLQVFNRYLPDINDPAKVKEAILSLFYEKGRKKLALWRQHDATAFFLLFDHRENVELRHGSFDFRIALKCLDDPEAFSNKLVDFLVGVTDITPNINARIALSPIDIPADCSAHSRYFGNPERSYLESLGELVGLTLSDYYHINGAEWFNLLSPMLTARLFGSRKNEPRYADVTVEKLGTGNTVVRATSSIDKLEPCDLANVRRYLYPVLYPGTGEYFFEDYNDSTCITSWAKPRLEWELLPIFPEEIIVKEDSILFSYYTGEETQDW